MAEEDEEKTAFITPTWRAKDVGEADPRTPMGQGPFLVRRGAVIAQRADRGEARERLYPASELSGEIILLLLLVWSYCVLARER